MFLKADGDGIYLRGSAHLSQGKLGFCLGWRKISDYDESGFAANMFLRLLDYKQKDLGLGAYLALVTGH